MEESEVIVRGSDGQNVKFMVPSQGFTVANLKQKIFESRNLPVKDQRLLYGGQLLLDERTLESYNINDGFVIRLLISVPNPSASTTTLSTPGTAAPRNLANVFVSAATAGGRTMNFQDVPASCKVQRFKEMIYDRTGDDPDNIRLVFAGKEFQNNRAGTDMTLMDYGVDNNSTLHMVLRLEGGVRR